MKTFLAKFYRIISFSFVIIAMSHLSANAQDCMTYSIHHVSCAGGSDGSVTVTINNGTAPYNFSLFGTKFPPKFVNGHPSNTYTFTGIPSDNIFIVTQYTMAGSFVPCPLVSASLNEPVAITLSQTLTNNICNGGNIGSIDLTVNGGTPPYTYSWSNGASVEDISNLTAGTYSVEITDGSGCKVNSSYTITEPDAIDITGSQNNVNCFGGNNGDITLNVNGGTAPYTFAWSNGSTSQNIAGLVAGTYTVVVTDSEGCTNNAAFTITQPATALDATGSQNDVSCFGGSNGNITLNVAGGTSPYSFVWSNGATTQNISGLDAGSYNVVVTDSKGCTDNASFTVTEPIAVLDATGSQNNVSCFGGSNGNITLNVVGGNAPYTFVWSNGAATPNISGLAAGTYSVVVTDSKGCTDNASFTITQPDVLDATGSQNNVSCLGANNGTINLSLIGGTAPYSFVWSNGATSQNVSGLTAGSYNVAVTDANGCTDNASFTITQPATALDATGSQNNVSCFGGTNGDITLNVTGGTSPYIFAWSNGATTQNVSGLAAGSYNVVVTDANGCTSNSSFTITQPLNALNATGSQNDVSCFNGSNGSVNLNVSGGTSPYSFIWSNGATSQNVSGLTAATYTVLVTDAKGCTANASFTITQPAIFEATGSQNDVNCFNGNTGSISLTITGGVAPFSYLWSNGATSQNITGLVANSYTVVVTDNNGCTANAAFTITQPAVQLDAAGSQNNISCFGDNTGDITLNVSGGTAPYTFNWSNGASTQNISGLVAGPYSVVVTDSKGCTANAAFTITQPIAPLNASGSQNNVSCFNGNNGDITLNVSGGTAPYAFAWTNGASSQNLASLSAGTYDVEVTDANGCKTNASFTITQPAIFEATGSKNDVNCFAASTGDITLAVNGGTAPFSFLWSNGATTQNLSGLPANTYSVVVTDANNCIANASFTITEPSAELTTSGSQNNIKCFGESNGDITLSVNGGTAPYTFAWSNGANTQDVSNLPAGNYDVLVTDANGCTTNASFTITQPLAALNASGSQNNVSCYNGNNGDITLNVSGGTVPYAFVWTNGASSQNLASLTAGTYDVEVTDANGCKADASFTITHPAVFEVTGSQSDANCFSASTGNIDLTVNGGTAPFTYAWSNGANTQDVSGLTAGPYSVIVTDDQGCTANASFTIDEPSAALTANGSQNNVSCFNGNNGDITLTVNGGTAPYLFAWDNGANTQDLTGLAANTYNVAITDANGCTTNASFTITQPLAALSATGTQNDVKCFGGNDGNITLNVNGGTAPYAFVWTNGASSQNLANLTAGTYDVEVTDANGCKTNAFFTITQPDGLTITGVPTEATCAGVNNGSIDVTISGGTAPFSFNWDNGASTEDVSNLATGTYIVTVTDPNGCSQNASFDIISGLELDIQLKVKPVSCNGGSDGSIAVTNVTNGNAPYSYLWNTSAIASSINNLTPNSYSVKVTDASGCYKDSTISIIEPTALTLSGSFNSPICSYGNNGQVTLSASGGTGSYEYSNDNSTWGSNNIFSGLNPGTYTYYAKDENGCTTDFIATLNSFDPVVISNITANITPLTCYGVSDAKISLNTATITGGAPAYSFSFNGITSSVPSYTGLGPGNQVINISDQNGCTYPYNFTIIPVDRLDIFVTPQNETCNNADGFIKITDIEGGTTPHNYAYSLGSTGPKIPYSGGEVIIPNLTTGVYTIYAYDLNVPNCANSVPVPLTRTPGPIPYITINPAICHDEANAQISVDSLQLGTPNFNIAIKEIDSIYTDTIKNVAKSAIFNNQLAWGYYHMVIEDQECPNYFRDVNYYYLYNENKQAYDTIRTDTMFVSQPEPFQVSTFQGNTDRYMNSGYFAVHNIIGGNEPPYQYSLDKINWTVVINPTDTIILSGLPKGTHTLYFKNLTSECEYSIRFTIESDFFIPNLITPNNDGHNDMFEIIALPAESELRIVNKWGARIYFNKNYDNGWDGANEAAGVYFYELILPNNKLYKGWVEIVR